MFWQETETFWFDEGITNWPEVSWGRHIVGTSTSLYTTSADESYTDQMPNEYSPAKIALPSNSTVRQLWNARG